MTTEAELLANLPADGVRVWRLLTPKLHLIATLGDSAWESREGDERWFKRATFVPNPHWTEITPALPDPSGDLPDGTLVRVTFEGITRDWGTKYGRVDTCSGWGTGSEFLHVAKATVEVLSIPTPPRPNPLDGKPGSLWRDPETGTVYQRTKVGGVINQPHLVAIDGFEFVSYCWILNAQSDSDVQNKIIARLVPAEMTA